MAKGNGVRDEVKEQRAKFKSLSFTKKIGYIWEYYRLPIFAVICAILVVASFVFAYIRNNYDTVCTIVSCDGYITGHRTDEDALTTGFTNYLGIDGKKTQIDIDYSYNMQGDDLDGAVTVSINKIYILANTGDMDGFMANYENILYFCTDADTFFLDLREVLTDEELDYLSDYIIYYTDANGENVPVAVDISEAPEITATDLSIEHPCYGIVNTSPNYENAADFIRFVFDM